MAKDIIIGIVLIIISFILFTNKLVFISGLLLFFVGMYIARQSTKLENDWMNAPLIIHNPTFKKLQNFVCFTSLFGGIILMLYSLFN